MRHFSYLVTALFICLIGCVPTSAGVENIRIAVLRDAKDFVLTVRGSYTITEFKTGKQLDSGRRLRRSHVYLDKDGLVIGRSIYTVSDILVETDKDIKIQTRKGKKLYRGAVRIYASEDKLNVVNILDLERYVKGVLYHEVSDEWPMEAMKAQAVAARTYAMYQMADMKDAPFDVTNDIYSQVYGGRSAEKYRTNIAVDRTRGQFLSYQGKVVPAYFHSNSGGHTENAKVIWGHDIPPLKGVKDPYAEGSPGYSWKRNFQSSSVQKILIDAGIDVGPIKNIEVEGRTASGRVKQLLFTSRNGKRTEVDGHKFRHILGPNLVRSNLFNVEMKGYYFDLIGKGWGHGVGMCQWGANTMARKRYDYLEILEHYYPGAKVENAL